VNSDDGDEWGEFARALVAELARLQQDAIIILMERGKSWHFAQFVQVGGYPAGGDPRIGFLRAEVGGEAVDDDGTQRPTARGTRILEALHWRPADPNDTNWWREVDWPATSTEYAELVNAVVAVLRDLNEVARPSDLVYRAWEVTGRHWPVFLPGVEPEEPCGARLPG
jgi:hypothetical protein